MQLPDYLTEVYAELEPCPYRDGVVAQMPLYVSRGALNLEQVDEVLAQGIRRSGLYFYNTRCPLCSECLPTRVRVEDFEPNRSQRRAFKRAMQQDVSLYVDLPQVDGRRVELFNAHREKRGLVGRGGTVGRDEYEQFLNMANCPVLELSQWYEERLIAVTILDVGGNSMSAVYTYFDPEYAKLSPGTVAIMSAMRLCESKQVKWLYLGMYVADNPHLSYKEKYLPQERLVDDEWKPFAKK